MADKVFSSDKKKFFKKVRYCDSIFALYMESVGLLVVVIEAQRQQLHL